MIAERAKRAWIFCIIALRIKKHIFMRRILFCLFLGIMSLGGTLFAQPKEITIEDIWTNFLFYPKGVNGYEPMANGSYYTIVGESGIEKYSYETGKKIETLLANETLLEASNQIISIQYIDSYKFDKEEKQILLALDEEYIYRRSTKAYYYIYNCKEKSLQPLSNNAKGKQSFATFSPDGKMVAFVRDNNIFIKELDNNRELQITFDGDENRIKNGIADWVYEEELSIAQCFEWSPDGNKIAYLRFNESRVKEFSLTTYGSLYPEQYSYKYPKAGEDNSLVDVYYYDLTTEKKNKLNLGDNSNCYFPRIYWLSNSTELMALKLNRHQNKLEFYRYNTTTGAQEVVFTDENKWWLEISDTYYFMDDNKTMVVTSERDGYNHLYLVEFGGETKQITRGNWEVAEICGINAKKRLIYYLSNESAVLNRDLYVISFDGTNKRLLTSGSGWNDVSLSPNGLYYLNSYTDINTPPVFTIHDAAGKQLRELENNANLKELMKTYGFSQKELFNFTTTEGISLNGWMIKPNDFDPARKYPVLIYLYGGPGSQEVENSFSRSQDFAWYQLLAQKGYIVVCVDGRGTTGRGDAFEKCVYKQMGKLETLDQLETVKYLKTLQYVDANRLGIWGWSFGGYLAALAMFQSEGQFKMGISVAPVTNWRNYDNIYTERFLQTPQENPTGYDDNSPVFYADKLSGKYLLIHGTADDNVHFQNSMELADALIRNNKQFDQFFYPNKNHFIYGGITRYHLYTKLTQYILENL